MRRLAAAITLLSLSLIFPASYSFAEDPVEFIPSDVRAKHPELKFIPEKADADATKVILPVGAKEIGVRLFHDYVGHTVFSEGATAIELQIDGHYTQIAAVFTQGMAYLEQLGLKRWDPSKEEPAFDVPLYKLNDFVREHFPEDQTTYFSKFVDREVIDHGERRHVAHVSIRGIPCFIFYEVMEARTGEFGGIVVAQNPFVRKIILPGWILSLDDDLHTAPELISIEQTTDYTLSNLAPYIDRYFYQGRIDISAADISTSWKGQASTEELMEKYLDLTDPQQLVVRRSDGDISFMLTNVVPYYKERAWTALEIRKNGVLIQLPHHYYGSADQPRFKIWEDGSAEEYGLIADASKNCPETIRAVREMNYSRPAQGAPISLSGTSFNYQGTPIEIQYHVSYGDRYVSQIRVFPAANSTDPVVTITFVKPGNADSYVSTAAHVELANAME